MENKELEALMGLVNKDEDMLKKAEENRELKQDSILNAAKDSKEILTKSEDFNCEEKETNFLCKNLDEYKKELEVYRSEDDTDDITLKLEVLKANLIEMNRKNNETCKDIDELICMVQGKPNF